MMSRVDGETASFWAALVAAERLHRAWLDELEDALLVGPAKASCSGLPDARHPELRATTEAGEIAFHLHLFEPWLREAWKVDGPPFSDVVSGTTSDPSLIASVPVMTAEALAAGLAKEPARPPRVWVP